MLLEGLVSTETGTLLTDTTAANKSIYGCTAQDSLRTLTKLQMLIAFAENCYRPHETCNAY